MKSAILWVVLGIPALGVDATLSAQPLAALELYVRNFAGVPADVMAGAKEELKRVFREIRVEVKWMDVDPFGVTESSGANQLNIYVMASTFLGRDVQSKETMGMVWKKSGANKATILIAYVFYDRIQEFVRNSTQDFARKASTARILAYTIAHEAGHLLLTSIHHFPKGIMRPRWDTGDLLGKGTVYFTVPQGEEIRKYLLQVTPD